MLSMKKLSIISNQIKNNTFSYTGKGSFEAVVNKNKEVILSWLEDLLPLQSQIDLLLEQEGLEFQKRNYTRILTKIFPNEYKEFVSLNILVRDANIVAQYYDKEYNITILYDNLVADKYLKYPGKYDKYVEFGIFQKFVMMYRDDLISSLNQENQSTVKKPVQQNKAEEKEDLSILKSDDDKVEIDVISPIDEDLLLKEEEERKEKKEKDTNWTNLLLGKLR